MSTFQEAAGFAIVPTGNGYRLSDNPGFCCWGVLKPLFRTPDLAADHAHLCLDFKEGRRMTVPAPITGFEAD